MSDASPDRSAANQAIIEAYKEGVVEASSIPVIWFDPDQIVFPEEGKPDQKSLGQQLQEQLDQQIPNISSGLTVLTMEGYAKKLIRLGPQVQGLTFEGEKYSIGVLPAEVLLTKEGWLNAFLDASEEVKACFAETMPDDMAALWRLIGNHEGEHCNSDVEFSPAPSPEIADYLLDMAKLRHERLADERAFVLAEERGDHEILSCFKDYRHLNAGLDLTHSTAAVVDAGDPVSVAHMEIITNFRGWMHGLVQVNFDWESFSGDEKTAASLLHHDPDAYFETIHLSQVDYTQEVMAAYEADPSLDSVAEVVQWQIFLDYSGNYEDAYRRRALGQDVPERSPSQLIPQEREDEYYRQLEIHLEGEEPDHDHDHAGIQYEQGVDGTAYTTHVSGLVSGQPSLNWSEGLKVGDASMGQVFMQAADPSSENISMVNAKLDVGEGGLTTDRDFTQSSEYSVLAFT